MTLFLRKIKLDAVLEYACKNVYNSKLMSKHSLHVSPESKASKCPKRIFKKSSSQDNVNLKSVYTHTVTMQATENQIIDKKQETKTEYLDSPIKSEHDNKEYRVIKLPNGLTALLIADVHAASTLSDVDEDDHDEDEEDEDSIDDNDESETDEEDEEEEENELHRADEEKDTYSKRLKREEKMAACGLCVGVGSFSDPPEIPGMAHFLEHMVFMGSEKYPQENDFDTFIKKKGGSNNASTDCEQTTFYFEVQEKHLLPALDRFAQFFIKPLMKKDAITRERESVESEFQMALPSDFYRREQLFCTFATPNHPATKFAWGNLITLRDNVSDDKLYEELHKFRERHYSAHRMTLAIQAKLPLDVLEEYVTQCFANVPNNGLRSDDFSKFTGVNAFDTPIYKKIYKIKPIRDLCQVELTWVMPSMHHLYKSKPLEYVSWIVGHEGKGSLSSYLRQKMWCLEVISGNEDTGFEHSSMYALFRIYLNLTEEGYNNLKDVLGAVFSYINLLQKEGPQQRIYDELYQIEEANFRFTDEVPPVDYVEDLCENMHFYPSKDYITGSDLYFEYNPNAIQDCLNYLTPDKVNIIIFNKKFNEEEFNKVEPWFNTKYSDMDIPKDWIESWKTMEILPDFHLPLPNEFLTTDFTLIPLPQNISKYPQKIFHDDICEIWYRPDPKFRLPECYMYFYLISPLMLESAKNMTMMDIFVGILKQLLPEELYPATVVGLSYQAYTSEKGVIIKVNGYNQKLPLLLNTIIKYIANFQDLITKDLFDVVKEDQSRIYYNTFIKPGKLIKDLRLSLLMDTYWTAVDKHTAVSNVEFEEFRNFIKTFTERIYIQSLVQGNMTEENVIKNVRECIKLLSCGPLLPGTMPELKVMEIPLGTHYCKINNFNKTDVNSVVINYYQSGLASIKLGVIIELLMMTMEEPLFNQLRTLEQLGYSVSCFMRDTFGILGYSITVHTQADKYTTEHVDERIETFLESFKKALNEIDEKEVEGIKEALTKLKQCADIHLREEVERNWAEIISGNYMFDKLEKEVAAIEHMNVEELRKWTADHTLNGDNLRKLSVHVVGVAPDEKTSDQNAITTSDKEMQDSIPPESNGKRKYHLEYIANKVDDAKRMRESHISDIQEYKRNLAVYPIQKNYS